LILAVAFAPACKKETFGSRSDPDVVEAGARVNGRTYAEWSAAWWQFVLSFPVSTSPLCRDDNCDTGQSGPVWFLAGKWGDSPVVAVRRCNIPAGKYVFFPVVNIMANNEGYVPPKTVEELRAAAREQIDSCTARCWFDGRELAGPELLHRVVSPVFRYKLPAGNFWKVPAGTLVDPVVSDGIWVMLKPPAAGNHVIRFTASSGVAAYAFDITYQIEVAAPVK